MNFTPVIAIVASGILWLVGGLFLLIKGLNLVVLAVNPEYFGAHAALVPYLSTLVGGKEQAALLVITFGLLIGLFKGRVVLAKSVKRVVARILSLPLPIKIQQIYSWKYVALIGSMVGLGVAIRWMQLPVDLHGLIDVAIGSSLVNGSMIYFRLAVFSKESQPKL
ncbi:MAG: hypothetical protein HYX48_04270 [Chlamydiales bacterium]|nr:hypothetical protein [Chlamydiales bacterium]